MNTPQNSNKKSQFYPKRMLMSRAETEVTNKQHQNRAIQLS